jgi:hypothetical protein
MVVGLVASGIPSGCRCRERADVTQKKRKPAAKPNASPARGPGNARQFTDQTAAQKRLAAQRAMAAASGSRTARRKRLMTTVGAPIAVVILIAAVIVAVAATRGSSSSVSHTPVAAGSSLQTKVTSVPTSVFNTVGTGSGVTAPSPLTGSALTGNKLPRVLYVGAEWCPYCAAERWALAAALSRFGTLTGLQTTYSSPDRDEPVQNVPTLTFAKAKLTSSTISATLTEIQNGSHKTIATLSSADEKLFEGIGQGGFPFVDIGGKYLISGVSYNPSLLKGKTHLQIANAMSDPTSPVAQAVDGTANYITAAICAATGQKPGAVCSSSGVKAATAALNPSA